MVSLSRYFDLKKKLNNKKLRFYLGRLRKGKGKGSLLFVRERSSLEDENWWKTNFNGRWPWWKETFDGRRPWLDDELWWKMTFNGRHPSMSPFSRINSTTFLLQGTTTYNPRAKVVPWRKKDVLWRKNCIWSMIVLLTGAWKFTSLEKISLLGKLPLLVVKVDLVFTC